MFFLIIIPYNVYNLNSDFTFIFKIKSYKSQHHNFTVVNENEKYNLFL